MSQVRCCELLDWFALRIMKRDESKVDGQAKPVKPGKPKAAAKISPLAAALVLALAFVYMYRLPHAEARKKYWHSLVTALEGVRSRFPSHAVGNLGVAWSVLALVDHGYGVAAGRSNAQSKELFREFEQCGFVGLAQEGRCAMVLAQVQKRFVRNMEVEDGVAMNDALSENLFVTCICVLNLLPIFIVGKPGTSKTLTMQARSKACKWDGVR